MLRKCSVSVTDLKNVEHTVEVTAETLYEAIATALTTLHQDSWVDDIGEGLTTVNVVVQQPAIAHQVRMQDFLSWLNRSGRSPLEMVQREKLRTILRKS
jgi:hypothetical protein